MPSRRWQRRWRLATRAQHSRADTSTSRSRLDCERLIPASQIHREARVRCLGTTPRDRRRLRAPRYKSRRLQGGRIRSRPLIIDPVLAYSTFLGGNWGDYALGIAADAAGSAYVIGHTGGYSNGDPRNNNFPTTAGAFQASLLHLLRRL